MDLNCKELTLMRLYEISKPINIDVLPILERKKNKNKNMCNSFGRKTVSTKNEQSLNVVIEEKSHISSSFSFGTLLPVDTTILLLWCTVIVDMHILLLILHFSQYFKVYHQKLQYFYTISKTKHSSSNNNNK